MMELQVANVFKNFGGVQALKGVSLQITGNELVGMIGPNGSGKTTLINVIGGIHKPERGEVHFNHQRIDGLRPNQIARLGIGRTFQVTRAFHRMTVMENLLVPAEAIFPERGRRALQAKAMEVLEFLNMAHLRNDYARSLSGGQRKLLELGQVLMAEPQLIMLDEPFAGVHPKLMEVIMHYISALHEQGKGFLIISHDMTSMFQFVRRLVVLNYGEIIADDAPEVVRKDARVIEAYLGEEEEEPAQAAHPN